MSYSSNISTSPEIANAPPSTQSFQSPVKKSRWATESPSNANSTQFFGRTSADLPISDSNFGGEDLTKLHSSPIMSSPALKPNIPVQHLFGIAGSRTPPRPLTSVTAFGNRAKLPMNSTPSPNDYQKPGAVSPPPLLPPPWQTAKPSPNEDDGDEAKTTPKDSITSFDFKKPSPEVIGFSEDSNEVTEQAELEDPLNTQAISDEVGKMLQMMKMDAHDLAQCIGCPVRGVFGALRRADKPWSQLTNYKRHVFSQLAQWLDSVRMSHNLDDAPQQQPESDPVIFPEPVSETKQTLLQNKGPELEPFPNLDDDEHEVKVVMVENLEQRPPPLAQEIDLKGSPITQNLQSPSPISSAKDLKIVEEEPPSKQSILEAELEQVSPAKASTDQDDLCEIVADHHEQKQSELFDRFIMSAIKNAQARKTEQQQEAPLALTTQQTSQSPNLLRREAPSVSSYNSDDEPEAVALSLSQKPDLVKVAEPQKPPVLPPLPSPPPPPPQDFDDSDDEEDQRAFSAMKAAIMLQRDYTPNPMMAKRPMQEETLDLTTEPSSKLRKTLPQFLQNQQVVESTGGSGLPDSMMKSMSESVDKSIASVKKRFPNGQPIHSPKAQTPKQKPAKAPLTLFGTPLALDKANSAKAPAPSTPSARGGVVIPQPMMPVGNGAFKPLPKPVAQPPSQTFSMDPMAASTGLLTKSQSRGRPLKASQSGMYPSIGIGRGPVPQPLSLQMPQMGSGNTSVPVQKPMPMPQQQPQAASAPQPQQVLQQSTELTDDGNRPLVTKCKGYLLFVQNINVTDQRQRLGSISRTPLFLGANLSIAHGKRYGLIGPSECGTSQLLKYIARDPSFGSLLPPNQILYVDMTSSMTSGHRIDCYYDEIDADQTCKIENMQMTAIEFVIEYERRWRELKQEEANLEAAMRNASGPNDQTTRDAFFMLRKVYEKLCCLNSGESESKARHLLEGLGFSAELQRMPMSRLSPRSRKVACLAQALYAEPALLLIDQPTQLLSVDSIMWLEAFMQGWPNSIIFTTHDRNFLDNVSSVIIYVYDKKLFYYQGNYTSFKQRLARQ